MFDIHTIDGKKYIVVGLSAQSKDGCWGEPEWKTAKKVLEVCIAEMFEEPLTYQKASWRSIEQFEREISSATFSYDTSSGTCFNHSAAKEAK